MNIEGQELPEMGQQVLLKLEDGDTIIGYLEKIYLNQFHYKDVNKHSIIQQKVIGWMHLPVDSFIEIAESFQE